jgi:hypothetical protein
MKVRELIITCCAVLLLTPFIAYTSANAQKLKCTLIFHDSIYIGTMKPRWFNKITLLPITTDSTNIIGAKGMFYSETFGNAAFSITENKLNTPDSLMIQATFGWHPINKIKLKKGVLKFEFDWSFRPTPTMKDLDILNKADEILMDETMWDKNDDRDCKADSINDRFSLYCVIHKAMMDVTSDFNHRGAVLEIVRKTIREANPNTYYQHDLMDFNNQNDFTAVKALLFLSKEKLEEVMAKQNDEKRSR